ncbi:type II toxin-antitoxin system MqsA family antitoxin [bacterium]|nr:type II toxin-antitoxin system MqsA family antitoxin [FCB group bacterium]MBL7191005.1 type II toxin-antitoxin system MqsA family antitoxin [bacterium]
MTTTDKPQYCPLCSGNIIAGKTTYSVDLGFGVVVVRDVPAMVCDQCGEDWINSDTAKELERITDEARRKQTQVNIVSMSLEKNTQPVVS